MRAGCGPEKEIVTRDSGLPRTCIPEQGGGIYLPYYLYTCIVIFSVFLFLRLLHVMRKQKAEHAPPRRRTFSDPFTAALLPPPDETATEREVRLRAELDAKKISDSIDDMLHQERNEKKKLRPEVNVLLLGQSESGKSTTLKRKHLSL